MLLKLMRKDLILHWKGIVALPVAALGLLIYAVLRDGSDLDPAFLLTMVAVMSGFAPVIVQAREDKLRTGVLTCSLPVGRTAVVGARYLGAWILFAAFVALAAALFLLLRGPAVLPAAFRPQTIFAMLTAYTLAVGIMLPFVQRFGFMGVLVALVALQVLGILLIGSSILLPGRSWIAVLIDAVTDFTVTSQARLGALRYYALFSLLLLALNAGSFGLSAAVYRRREL